MMEEEQEYPEDFEENQVEEPSTEIYLWGDDSRGQLGLSGVFGDA